MRPGRIDRILYVPPPDNEARLRILGITTEKMKIDANVDLAELSVVTEGYSGAEIVQVWMALTIRFIQFYYLILNFVLRFLFIGLVRFNFLSLLFLTL
jgi:hypothetical protein